MCFLFFLQKLVAQMKQDPQVRSKLLFLISTSEASNFSDVFFHGICFLLERRSEEAAPRTSSKDHGAQREAGTRFSFVLTSSCPWARLKRDLL